MRIIEFAFRACRKVIYKCYSECYEKCTFVVNREAELTIGDNVRIS